MARKKDKPTFNVEHNNNENCDLNKSEAQSFMQLLVNSFQQGGYCILEALRLVKAKNKNKEIDLMLNDEKHSTEYEAEQRFPFIK